MSWLSLDQSLTESLYLMSVNDRTVQFIAVGLGAAFVYLIPLVLIIFFSQRKNRLISVNIFLATVFTWQGLNNFIGTLVYNQTGFRDRPFVSQGLLELFFEQPQRAFPSDHAAVLMLVTLALFHYKKTAWGWVFLVGTLTSGLARVVVGFHHIGDIVAGAAVGLLGYGLLVLLDRPLRRVTARVFGYQVTDDDVGRQSV